MMMPTVPVGALTLTCLLAGPSAAPPGWERAAELTPYLTAAAKKAECEDDQVPTWLIFKGVDKPISLGTYLKEHQRP